MLGKRISEKRRAISMQDPAFFEFTADQRDRYSITRDIDVLGDFSKLPNPPTVFILDPAETKHQHLLDSDELDVQATLFRMYVSGVENFDAPFETEEINAQRRIKDSCYKMFGWEIAKEIGGLIQQFAKSETACFFAPDGWQDIVKGMLTRRAWMSVTDEQHATSPTDGETSE